MPLRELMIQFRQAGTTADIVYEVLRHCIVNGELAPGSKLRADALAKTMTVSRTPVREALKRLEAGGFASLSPRSGLVVTELTDQDLVEVMCVREALEGTAARLAAENATPADLTRIHSLVEEIARRAREEGGDEALRSRIRECRNAIYSACHNKLLVQLLEAMQLRARQFRAAPLFYLAGRPLEVVEEMSKLATAIESRDVNLAEWWARQHRRKATELRIKVIRAEG